MLTPQPDERRRGPLEPFETSALTGFAAAAVLHAVLAVVRGDRGAGALFGAIGILSCAGLWLLRARRMFGGALAVPAGLFLATMGVYGAYTATNVPFAGVLARFAVPLLLILTGALLLFADQDRQFQLGTFALAAVAFAVAQAVLTLEWRSGVRPIPIEHHVPGGVAAELQLVPLARSFVEALNARDASAIAARTTPGVRFVDSRGNVLPAGQLPEGAIAVTRWIVEDNTVIAFGTASGRPAVWRAEFRGARISEWQVYTDASAR